MLHKRNRIMCAMCIVLCHHIFCVTNQCDYRHCCDVIGATAHCVLVFYIMELWYYISNAHQRNAGHRIIFFSVFSCRVYRRIDLLCKMCGALFEM